MKDPISAAVRLGLSFSNLTCCKGLALWRMFFYPQFIYEVPPTPGSREVRPSSTPHIRQAQCVLSHYRRARLRLEEQRRLPESSLSPYQGDSFWRKLRSFYLKSVYPTVSTTDRTNSPAGSSNGWPLPDP